MKNKIIVSILGITIMFAFVTIIYNSNNDMTFTKDGIIYALSVNGSKATSFPNKGMYQVDVECDNSRGKWDYDNWKLYIENITGEVSCNISFTTISKTYLNNKIIGFSGTTQGTGQVVNEKGYRYEGKDPNNYIWFNNELWRIIGVFDSTNHGQSGINLTKIIRESPIGHLAWDKNNRSNYGFSWFNSSLRKLLNPDSNYSNSGAYYNKQNGTNSGYCYNYGSTLEGICDYSQTGISSISRNMIKKVLWHCGSSTSNNVSTVYDAEIGSSDTVEGYIGLMYASDYGYAVLSSSCSRTTTNYASAECAGQNWMYGKSSEWLITSYSSSYYVYAISGGGDFSGLNNNASSNLAFRPVLYLDSSVYVLDGDGSIKNPYIIAM